jgi:hypothetical protein
MRCHHRNNAAARKTTSRIPDPPQQKTASSSAPLKTPRRWGWSSGKLILCSAATATQAPPPETLSLALFTGQTRGPKVLPTSRRPSPPPAVRRTGGGEENPRIRRPKTEQGRTPSFSPLWAVARGKGKDRTNCQEYPLLSALRRRRLPYLGMTIWTRGTGGFTVESFQSPPGGCISMLFSLFLLIFSCNQRTTSW